MIQTACIVALVALGVAVVVCVIAGMVIDLGWRLTVAMWGAAAVLSLLLAGAVGAFN